MITATAGHLDHQPVRRIGDDDRCVTLGGPKSEPVESSRVGTRLPQGILKPSKVSFEGFEGRRVGVIYSLMAIGSMLRPRWLPEKSFPPYAYLPGRQPHPVRDPAGHSYHVEPMPVAAEASLGSDVFLWGLDLFNHGYYWEAHEAWEGLWQVVDRGGPSRMLFKGLILLSAAGVKIREGKHAAAVRHAGRAAALLRRLMKVPELAFERALGMSPAALAEYAEAAAKTHAALQATAPGQPQPVFNFILGSNSHGRPSGQVSRRLL